MQSFLDITGAMGCASPDELGPELIHQRGPSGRVRSHAEMYARLEPGQLRGGDIPDYYAGDWRRASADHF